MNHDDRLWISEFTFDALASSIHIVLTADPEHGTPYREVNIPNVIDFHIKRYHDVQENCLGDYTGCMTSAAGKHWRYKMDTGDATVTFDALDKVIV